MKKVFLAALLMVGSGAVLADDPRISYTYVGIDYNHMENDYWKDFNGPTLYGSIALSDFFHVTAGYTHSDISVKMDTVELTPSTNFRHNVITTNEGITGDADSFSLGVGFHGFVSDNLSWNIDVAHRETKYGVHYNQYTRYNPYSDTYIFEHVVDKGDIDAGFIALGVRTILAENFELGASINASIPEWRGEDAVYSTNISGEYFVLEGLSLVAKIGLGENKLRSISGGIRYTF